MRYKTDFTPIQATARSFVQQVLPGRRIVLSGDVLGSRGTITYDFTSYGAKTVVSATEVFAETDSDYRNYVISRYYAATFDGVAARIEKPNREHGAQSPRGACLTRSFNLPILLSG